NYELAFPVLARYGLKATIFTVTGLAGQTQGDLTYLSWPEMAAMERSGVIELQAHTHDGHYKVGNVPALQSWPRTQVAADLAQLRQGFAEAGLRAPTAYAYPFGAFSQDTIAELQARGVRLGFTVEHGYVQQGADPMRLPRLIIYPATSACRFAELVSGNSHCNPDISSSLYVDY
ncbi:MAG TPA: polysaccharide deacetylase family protein, partial [Symbiobacteriaceae bacterium]|nr:polysaccharide deacetylase family protein [Symbiobacteriaceae bacterium]